MNRKERRADRKRGNASGTAARAAGGDGGAITAELMATAQRHYQEGRPAQAADICNQLLAREPGHVHALNQLALIHQALGRHRQAVKALKKAIASDPFNAACHYNIGSSYQALTAEDEAKNHFKKAIAFGMHHKNTEDLILQNTTITTCVDRIEETWPVAPIADLFGSATLQIIANDAFLRCALETLLIRGAALREFLTLLRLRLLAIADSDIELASADIAVVRLLCSLAQQCFINEYVFSQGEAETELSSRLKALLLQKLEHEDAIPELLIAAVAAYFPLHSLANARELLSRNGLKLTAKLLRQQIREPLQEAEDLETISALTEIDDALSLRVMRQYAENPYPRWTINPVAAFAGERQALTASVEAGGAKSEILIAGCGTGQHAFEVAQYYPEARVLAIDMSRPSLAYARRKSREENLRNIEYAQADILKLGALGSRFDQIEAVGVLHHLENPELGGASCFHCCGRRGRCASAFTAKPLVAPTLRCGNSLPRANTFRYRRIFAIADRKYCADPTNEAGEASSNPRISTVPADAATTFSM